MNLTRRHLRRVLEQAANPQGDSTPDPAFIDALEQRLLNRSTAISQPTDAANLPGSRVSTDGGNLARTHLPGSTPSMDLGYVAPTSVPGSMPPKTSGSVIPLFGPTNGAQSPLVGASLPPVGWSFEPQGDGSVDELAERRRRRGRHAFAGVAAGIVLLTGTVSAAAMLRDRSDRVVITPATDLPASSSTTALVTTTTAATSPTLSGSVSVTTVVILPAGPPSAPAAAPVASAEPPTTSGDPSVPLAPAVATTVRPTSVPTTAPTTIALPSTTPTTTAAPTPTATAPTTAAKPTTTVAPTSSTEVTIPVTLSLSCSAISATSVRCTWSKSTDPSVTGYRLLRGQGSSSGRVFSTGPGDSATTDTIAAGGSDYTYLVHAVRADGTSVAHSAAVAIHCCTVN
jgi:hypothetical protein